MEDSNKINSCHDNKKRKILSSKIDNKISNKDYKDKNKDYDDNNQDDTINDKIHSNTLKLMQLLVKNTDYFKSLDNTNTNKSAWNDILISLLKDPKLNTTTTII